MLVNCLLELVLLFFHLYSFCFRSLVANLAAANCFTSDHLDVPSNWKLVEQAEVFYTAVSPVNKRNRNHWAVGGGEEGC